MCQYDDSTATATDISFEYVFTVSLSIKSKKYNVVLTYVFFVDTRTK